VNTFGRRCLHLPLPTRSARLARRTLGLVESLRGPQLEAAVRNARSGLSLEREARLASGVDSERAMTSAELKASLFASVIIDLVEAGWCLDLDEGEVYVTAPEWRHRGASATHADLRSEKAAVRRSLEARARERMSSPGTRSFLHRLEGEGVLQLVAEGRVLASALAKRGPSSVIPTLWPARPQDGADPVTGVPLHDIYKYLRFSWSFPYGSTPGRSLPFLIRDEGMPGAPVCGLLCLSSPVPRLEARDANFGWSPDHLRLQVVGLGLIEDAQDGAPGALAGALREAASVATLGLPEEVRTRRVAQAIDWIARCLELPPTRSVEELARSACRVSAQERRQRARSSRRRIAFDLVRELETSLSSTSFEGLPVDERSAREDPASASIELSRIAEEARVKVKGLKKAGPERERFLEALYEKKRSKLLAQLVPARADLEGVAENLRADEPLRRALEAAVAPPRINRGVRVALERRRVRLLAAQVAEVSVCGAVPPYGPILGGKLAGLLALSADVARHYHEAYEGRAGEIQARMAGREITLANDLIGLSTSSFYPIGSSQYNRLGLPDELGGARWRFAGTTRGFGTLHFSEGTSAWAAQLLHRDQERTASIFGEGPSERVRKLRDALLVAGLPAAQLLDHGMMRPAYTAVLRSGAAIGDLLQEEPHHLRGPSCSDVAQFWRERWLLGRSRSAEVLRAVARHKSEDLRMSRFVAGAAALTPPGLE
jgi:hypothetical protein